MKRRYAILIVLAVTTVVFLAAEAPCRAAEEGERPRREFQRREMSDEMVERMLGQLAEQAGISRSQIADICVVGNTAMTHLLFGLPVQQLQRVDDSSVTSYFKM